MMTAEQLKDSILQLAIEGKLVDQRSQDGDAESLLNEIADKKRKAISKAHLKEIKGKATIQEVPFEIPTNWRWVRLGTLALIISDGTHKTPHYIDKGIPFLSVKDVSGGYFDLTKVKYISPEEHSELIKRCHPQKGDILVCRIGTLGKAIKVSVDFDFSIFVSLGLLRLVDERIVNYVIWVINSGYGKKWIDNVKVGGGTHTNKINLNSFPDFLIPLPPIAEQDRIVEKIEYLMSFVEQYGAVSKKLDKLNTEFPDQVKKSILQMAVEGKLVEQRPEEGTGEELFQKIQAEKAKLINEGKIKKQKPLAEITDEEKPFDIPDNWIWVRLKDLGDFSSGKTPSMSDVRNWQNGKVPWITSKDMKKKYLSTSQMLISGYAASEMKLYPPETMLMVVRSGILKRMLPISILKVNSVC